MNITKKSRQQLKDFFATNKMPTASNFADLIDAMVNQKDDRITQPDGGPVSIVALPGAKKPALHLYEASSAEKSDTGLFSEPRPKWVIRFGPVPGADGFTISDGADNDRLFIDSTTGRVGIGTTSPSALLAVAGDFKAQSASITGALSVAGALDITSRVTASSTLDVLGAVMAAKTLTVTGDISAMARLTVTKGVTANAGVDIKTAARTGTHAKDRPLYVTGAITDDAGSEFRHTDGTKGIGLGLTTIYATGTNQDLNLKANGTGAIKLVAGAGADVSTATRTGTHATNRPLYVTGAITDDAGSEFRHSDGTKGIGLGLTTIYATGPNQNLNLKANGTGEIRVKSSLVAESSITIGGRKATKIVNDMVSDSADDTALPTRAAVLSHVRASIDVRGILPVGAIILWSGSSSKIPAGWSLCDGSNGTPNLTGQFVLGATKAQIDTTANRTGGSSSITLTVAQLPAHHHEFKVHVRRGSVNDKDSCEWGIIQRAVNSGQDDIINSSSNAYIDHTDTGGGQAITLPLPPYYLVAYIMRTS